MSLKTKFLKAATKAAFYGKKYSPEILTGVGIIGAAATVYLTVKAVKKQEETTEDYETREAAGEVITKQERTIKVIKNWWKPVITSIVALVAIVGSCYISRNRVIALTGAFGAATAQYTTLYNNVVKEVGEEKANEMTLPIQTRINENGETYTVCLPSNYLSGVWLDECGIYNPNKTYTECIKDITKINKHLYSVYSNHNKERLNFQTVAQAIKLPMKGLNGLNQISFKFWPESGIQVEQLHSVDEVTGVESERIYLKWPYELEGTYYGKNVI